MSMKAFELVPAIERGKLTSDKFKAQIESIDVCGKNLYIGTSDCFIFHYCIEERNQAGKIAFHSEKQGHKYLGLKKPIVQIKAASALNRIIVLCDNTVTLLNMFDLEPVFSGAKIKGVVNFSVNDNPIRSNPFSVEVCVALKKKQLQIYTITEDRIVHVKDLPLPEPAIITGIDEHYVCAALNTQYCMIEVETAFIQDLFPYDNENTNPMVKKVTKEEFLLSGPSALGMFVTSAGISQRPPMQWSDNLIAVSCVQPYIVAMNDEFITIHSILDQQQKQAIPFQGGVFMDDFEGRLFIASAREIYSLVPVAFEKQIEALLYDKRVAEALELAENAHKTGMTKDKFMKIYKRIQQQAGFIEFSQQHFDEAQKLFLNGEVDVREIICLYPDLMPSGSNFTRSSPPLHEIPSISILVRNNDSVMETYKSFLRSFLEDVRNTKQSVGLKQEIDVALLKLYAENNSAELIPLLVSDTSCELADCVEYLERYQRHHALALLHKYHGENEKALHIWTRLVNGEIQDKSFQGLEFVVEFLANLNDHELVWKYLDWVLEKNEEFGVQILTQRPANEVQSERLRPDAVIDYLHRFPLAVVTYLEYLVFQKKLEKEKYHTHLAVLYLDKVLSLTKNHGSKKEDVDIARCKLRHMLQMSNLYRVQLILGKTKETEMHAECAILYGKLEEHDKALRILVHKLKDFGAAENYCLVNSQGKEASYRKRLFHILLSVYLDPSYETKDNLVAPAMSLLNSNVADFDTVKVLQLLPDTWSVSLLSQFLSRSLRKSMNKSRLARIETMMARGENLHVKQTCIELQQEPVILNDDRNCGVCSRALTDPTFIRYPNSVVTHVHCAKNKYVCPVTGKLFSTRPS
ncbi:hypothetical protein SNE40_003084 [Patella caerulea]|uniref:CNH domain-containing protein n=1 Tax=Patella caerulea TaxID=87958 RepID=A0AAN8Q4J6_PATCE